MCLRAISHHYLASVSLLRKQRKPQIFFVVVVVVIVVVVVVVVLLLLLLLLVLLLLLQFCLIALQNPSSYSNFQLVLLYFWFHRIQCLIFVFMCRFSLLGLCFVAEKTKENRGNCIFFFVLLQFCPLIRSFHLEKDT